MQVGEVDGSDERHAVGRQVECDGSQDAQRHHDERHRQIRNALEDAQAQIGHAPQTQRPRVPGGELLAELEQHLGRAAAGHLHTGDVRQLLDHDRDGQAERETAQHRPRNERGKVAEARRSRKREQNADEQHERAR